MGAIELVTPLATATVLDPRFKKLHFADAIACANAIQKIKELFKNITQQEGDSMESDSSDTSDKQEDSFSLWTDHHKLVHKNWKDNKSDDNLSDEIAVYLKSSVGRLG